jgi:hypothetical protein
MDSAHQKTPEAQKATQVVVCKWTRGELVRLLQMYNDKCLEYLGNVQAQTELTVIFNQTFVAGSESKPRCNHCNKFIADHEGRSEESPARRTDSTNDIGCPGLWSVLGLAGCVAQLRMEDEHSPCSSSCAASEQLSNAKSTTSSRVSSGSTTTLCGLVSCFWPQQERSSAVCVQSPASFSPLPPSWPGRIGKRINGLERADQPSGAVGLHRRHVPPNST